MTALTADFSVARRAFDVVVQLSAEPGERIALFGPSGAGKTTIIEVLAGLTPPTTGRACLGDVAISLPPPQRPRRRGRSPAPLAPPCAAAVGRVAIVRQPTALFPHLDVTTNVAYGRADPRLAAQVIDDLGLGALRRARPAALSGGQAQRVALARALARPAELLLLDEPMSAVDQPARRDLWAAVQHRISTAGATAVLVTHDLEEAQSFGDRLVLIDRGQVLQQGDPHDVVARPVSGRAAEVVGYDVFLQVMSAKGQLTTIALRSDEVHLAESVEQQRGPEGELRVEGTVLAATPSGAGYAVTVRVQPGCAVVLAPEWEGTTCEVCLVSARAGRRPAVGSTTSVVALHPYAFASETSCTR